MNPSFDIRPEALDTAAANLYVEAGPAAVSFVVLDDNKCFRAVVIYPFANGLSINDYNEQLGEILDSESLLQHAFRKTTIIWSFKESIIVPNEWMNKVDKQELVNLVHGDLAAGEIKTDFLFRHNLHNLYRVPQPVHVRMSNKFLYASQTHQYSLLPELASLAGDRLLALFYNNHVTVLLCRNGRLQMMQQFAYANAEDAAYHLLNVCAGFDMDTAGIVLQLSGMIDEASALYAGLYKYFLQVEMLDLPVGFDYTEAIREQPAHFFSHLFATAACA